MLKGLQTVKRHLCSLRMTKNTEDTAMIMRFIALYRNRRKNFERFHIDKVQKKSGELKNS